MFLVKIFKWDFISSVSFEKCKNQTSSFLMCVIKYEIPEVFTSFLQVLYDSGGCR